jgi:acrylyl-CoA reductase (NADPH)
MTRIAVTDQFKALVLTREAETVQHQIRRLSVDELPDGDVLVAVKYSSLNYKDCLAVTGRGKIVRRYPMIPGVDLTGEVLSSESPDFLPGDEVLLTGWGVGERYWGGYTQLARLRSEWLIPLPEGLEQARAMAIGSAGLTAMLCVMALEEQGVTPQLGTVLVTGASGGVGSVAVALLAELGFSVTAVTGNRDDDSYLTRLGAAEIISRSEFEQPARPLETQRWAGAVDTVGGKVLARLLAEMNYGGTVAATGLTGGSELHTTVMPFILRAIRMVGVEVTTCPVSLRKTAWGRLARELPESHLESIFKVISLEEVPAHAEKLIAGQIKGRVVVDLGL